MKRLLLCALLGSWALSAGVADVQSVYLLPMPGGLDQYLANRLSGVFRVVTDPKLADAVFTNQLGEPFEQQLAKLYPPPKPPIARRIRIKATSVSLAFPPSGAARAPSSWSI